ncbi:MAG: Phage SPO1 DNA polymerase-related protein [Methanothrix harundinacea]|uniref:Type-4 uracil-DNA glycosylase n=1 Tax=Methanothrix harundinacea TaxID=301375 RepID=A0A101FTQ0_9EURY|nr:MAG: Phage SPO1 DNA polymerase-related protein [Methanothrix harundinacea]KUK96593.1 MAG: Phage SPO1 DNA polymerase-related protein [Methanothrix harundinacea]
MIMRRRTRDQLDSLALEIRSCRRCPLSKDRTKAVPGEGPEWAEILLVGEAPGRDENLAGRPFVGRAGSVLDRCLEEAGIDRSRIFITNAVKCRPPNNRRPKNDEVEACRPYLEAQIELVQPKVVILMGNAATKAVLDLEGVTSLRGRLFKEIYLVTFHPAAVLRNGNLREVFISDLLAAKDKVDGRWPPARDEDYSD